MRSFEAHSFERDIGKIRSVSGMVRSKILESNPKYDQKINRLSDEELEDLDAVLGLAEQLLIKHRNKSDAYRLIKEFVDMMKGWSGSLGEINDEIQELIISAQYSVSEIKTAQCDVSSSLSFDKHKKEVEISEADNGTINLTKSAIPVYPQEYQ